MLSCRILLLPLILIFLLGSCSSGSDSEGKAMFPYYKRKKVFSNRFGARYGYMDKSGQRVTKVIFYSAHTFTDGRGCVSINKKRRLRYGYIATSGDYAIKPIYSDARPFHEGRALVRNDNEKWFVIDKNGKPLTKKKYDIASDYINGSCYAYVYLRTKQWRGFLGGRRSTSYYDMYRIDRNGKESLVASEVSNLDHRDSSTLRNLSNLGMYWVDDSSGNRIYGFKKISFEEFHQSPLSQCGNYRTEGKVQIKAKFTSAECFEGGYARVTLNSGKTGYIDTNGKVLFTFRDGR